MVDNLSPDQRRNCMRSVESKNTTPEMCIRKLIHSMGYRYALHKKSLPGTPDLVFVSRRKIIFINGCFWHKHNCRRGKISPQTNTDYWKNKHDKNVQRDQMNTNALRKGGWKVLVVWECSIRNSAVLQRKLEAFLS